VWGVVVGGGAGPGGPGAGGGGGMRFAALTAPRLAGCQDGCGLVPTPHILSDWHFFRPGECRKLSGESPLSNDSNISLDVRRHCGLSDA